ncbi:MAG: UDP-glucose/GDP-mannose dehydrogenase family protein [Armatimonadetes bacterium]|nr:UDP-glucose/GDP-mannose dehydrogenase family protein [Armatimonadota bacterium]
MNICIIGTGYVGLVTGAVFADLGNEVTCVDIDAEKIKSLQQGIMPIYEPGLEEMVSRNADDGRLFFTTDLGEGVLAADVVFIAVGTPSGPNGEPDITQVIEAAKGISQYIQRYKVIVNKSTVPIGTGNLVKEVIEQNQRSRVDFDVVSNPEFLREGSAIYDTLNPDRIIIGAPSQTSAMKLIELYAPLERPMLITDVTSAEIIKYVSNAFLAAKISFINLVAELCEVAGGDVVQVAKGMGFDKRIGEHFLQAGLGFGGSCFGKDLKALIHTSEKLGCNADLFKWVLSVNDAQPLRFVNKIKDVLGGLEDKTIGILGVAFKPNTDDMRDARSIEVINKLLAEGANVQVYDPVAMENCRRIIPNITYCDNAYAVAVGADAVLLVTEWNEFRFLNLDKIRQSMKRPVFFDGRNLYDPQRMQKLGFEYYCIGRASNCRRPI